MFNLGFGELLIIALVFIVVVGPDRLPELLRTLGKTLRSVQKANHDLQSSIGIDKLRQELMFPSDLHNPLKWRPKPTLHAPSEPPKSPTADALPPAKAGAAAAPIQEVPTPEGDNVDAETASVPSPQDSVQNGDKGGSGVTGQ